MPTKTTKSIKESILSRRQLRRDETKTKGQLTTKLPIDPTGTKGTLIRYVEGKYGKPIEVLIWSNSVRKLAEQLEVAPRTISRWRKEYPNGTESN